MPMVDTGMGDLGQQLLALAQIMGRRKDQQAQNLLGLALPGQTVAEVMPPDMARRALGRGYDPNRVLKPKTADDLANEAEIAFLEKIKTPEGQALLEQAQPGDVTSLGASITANKRLGIQGVTTPGALRTMAKTAATKATTADIAQGSVLDLVKEGVEGFKNAAPETRRAAGQKLAMGQTQENTEMERLQAILAAESTKFGIMFVANPNGHPLGKQLRQLGVDPVAAVAAASTGMLSLMGNIAQMTVDAAQGEIQMRVAAANRQTAYAIKQMEIDADYAERLSIATGNKLPPSAIIAVMRTKRGDIKDPKALAQYDAAAGLINEATESAYKVIVADAFSKGNPRAAALEQLIGVAKGVKDPKLVETFGDEIRRQLGELTATQMLGPRPEIPADASPQVRQQAQRRQEAWDAAAEQYGNIAPKSPGFFEKLDKWITGKAPGVADQQRKESGVINQGIPRSAMPQAPTGLQPTPPFVAPQTPAPAAAGPQASIKDLSPEDQAALQAFFGALAPKP